jgi:hypothetical protein
MSDDKEIPWWEREIPRLQVEIKKLNFALARATYEPTSRRITERMQALQGELDNARQAAAAHLRGRKTNHAGPFTYSDDYRCVTVRGETFTLTSRQAHMIQLLHRAHQNGKPEVSINSILEELETETSRWQDTWRSNRKARESLIKSGARKGTLHLNL